jgi:Cof subfamily protein (haloacid dehalogenase superfamily)
VIQPPQVGTRSARPTFTPRALLLDLDGTVLDAQVRLHPGTRDAIRAVAARIPVVIATGRMYRSALPWARELGIIAPLVCYQGALVRELPRADGSSGEVLLEKGVTPSAALRALHVCREHHWYFQAYADDDILCDEDTPEGELYTRISGVERTMVDDLEPIVRSGGSTKGVAVVTDRDEAARCRAVLAEALGDAARVTPSRPEFIEVVSPDVSKAAACALVCERSGVAMDQTIAFGDGANDIEMLDAAGFAVAVSGATDEVLAHADATCAPPEDDGVGTALRVLNIARGDEPI